MDLRDGPDEVRFRAELAAWLKSAVPAMGDTPDPDDWPARRAYDTRWQRMLFEAGYAGVDWPVEGGGRGASPTEQLIYVQEHERARAPYVGANFVGLLHAGPTIIVEGTPEQKAAHLPPILRGDHIWCQGFSEPDAGSDLASLRTRAVRDGDTYVVNGSKIWTSFAPVADYCELLVRTGPEDSRHHGITWLILPMDAPGVEVRPLRTITGEEEFAELHLDDVVVPVANRVGEENDGWRVAMTTFSFERGTAFVGELLESIERLRELRDVAERTEEPTRTALLARIGRLGADFDALWSLVRRNVSEAARRGVPGAGASVFKLSVSEIRHRLGELAMELCGPAALVRNDVDFGPCSARQGGPGNAGLVDLWLNSFSRTIAAGTSQIQRNIIAERILGLPRS